MITPATDYLTAEYATFTKGRDVPAGLVGFVGTELFAAYFAECTRGSLIRATAALYFKTAHLKPSGPGWRVRFVSEPVTPKIFGWDVIVDGEKTFFPASEYRVGLELSSLAIRSIRPHTMVEGDNDLLVTAYSGATVWSVHAVFAPKS